MNGFCRAVVPTTFKMFNRVPSILVVAAIMSQS
jgi:hypothetical protein